MSLNQMTRCCVRRGAVTIAGVRYYSDDLLALHGVVLDFVKRPDGRVFAEFPACQVELFRAR